MIVDRISEFKEYINTYTRRWWCTLVFPNAFANFQRGVDCRVKRGIFAVDKNFLTDASRLFGGINMTTGIVLEKARACRAEWLGWARGCLLMCTWFQRATVPRHRPSSPSVCSTDAVSHCAIYVHRFRDKSLVFTFVSSKVFEKSRSAKALLHNWTNIINEIRVQLYGIKDIVSLKISDFYGIHDYSLFISFG